MELIYILLFVTFAVPAAVLEYTENACFGLWERKTAAAHAQSAGYLHFRNNYVLIFSLMMGEVQYNLVIQLCTAQRAEMGKSTLPAATAAAAVAHMGHVSALSIHSHQESVQGCKAWCLVKRAKARDAQHCLV
jgi:hypothetical protein